MGSDPEPFKANLFLYCYQNKWPLDTIKGDLQKSSLDQKRFKDIYPVDLELV